DVESIRKIASQLAKISSTSRTGTAPAAIAGSSFSGVRFHTFRGTSDRARLTAMGCPMRPTPMKPVALTTIVAPSEERRAPWGAATGETLEAPRPRLGTLRDWEIRGERAHPE